MNKQLQQDWVDHAYNTVGNKELKVGQNANRRLVFMEGRLRLPFWSHDTGPQGGSSRREMLKAVQTCGVTALGQVLAMCLK